MYTTASGTPVIRLSSGIEATSKASAILTIQSIPAVVNSVSHRICEGCGKPITRRIRTCRDSGRFCSRSCAFTVKAVGGWNRGLGRPVASLIAFAICSECITLFVKRLKSRRRVCLSRSCEISLRNRGVRQRQLAKYHAAHPLKTRALQCENVRCGKIFLQHYRTGEHCKRFCSLRCMKRASRRGRNKNESRARRAGVPCTYGINPLKVFVR